MNGRGKQENINHGQESKGIPIFGDVRAMALQRQIEKSVSSAFHVPERELRAPTRRKAHTAFARQVAMYLAHVGCGMNYSEVGRLFGRDRTTAAHACRIIEDRRDDPGLDLSLDHLEQAVRHWADRRIMHS